MFQHLSKFTTALALVSALGLAGCGGGGSDPDPLPPGQADLMPMKVIDAPFYWDNNNGHTMHVHNIGDAASPATTVMVTYQTFSGDVVEMYPVPAIEAGGMSPPIKTTLPSGTTTSRYTVQVDSGAVVMEVDESNNEATEEVLF